MNIEIHDMALEARIQNRFKRPVPPAKRKLFVAGSDPGSVWRSAPRASARGRLSTRSDPSLRLVMAAKRSGPLEAFPRACKNVTPSIVCDNLQSAHSLPAGPPEPHPYKFESRRVTSSLLVSPKDQVVSSGSHPAPPVPVTDPGRVCCVRAKPCPRRLNDQGLPDSYGVYRSPWINCSFAHHLVVERYPRTMGGEETRRRFGR